MREVVPHITDKLKTILRGMGYNSEPEIIAVVPRAGAKIQDCWVNVPNAIQAEGGLQVTGRIVWKQEHGKWLDLEAHAVWQKPDGSIVDPTPKIRNESEILFVREPLEWNGYVIPARYKCFAPDARRLVELFEAQELRNSKIPFGEKREATDEEQAEDLEAMQLISRMFPNAFANAAADLRRHSY